MPLEDGYYLGCRSVERFDFAARIHAASNMIVFANDVVKLLPNDMFLQDEGTSATKCAGLSYPLYEVPSLHMRASTLRRIRCVAGIALKLFPFDCFLWNHHRSLLVRRVLSSYYNRAQVLPPLCVAFVVPAFFIPCASVLGLLYSFAAPAIILTGIVIVSVFLRSYPQHDLRPPHVTHESHAKHPHICSHTGPSPP